MVVADFDVKCVAVLEPKADSPFLVDRHRILTLSISLKAVQPITWRDRKIAEVDRVPRKPPS